jgi:predicted TIM-barrel fold metal-dependent hydrolase
MAGPDHFMFGTDARPLTVLMKQGVEVIEKFGLSPAAENKAYCDNAKRLLKI